MGDIGEGRRCPDSERARDAQLAPGIGSQLEPLDPTGRAQVVGADRDERDLRGRPAHLGKPDLRAHRQRVVDINALRALAPLPRAPAPRPSRPQPRTPQPRWSRRHSAPHTFG